MQRNQRMVLLGLAIVVVVVAAVVAVSSGGSKKKSETPSNAAQPAGVLVQVVNAKPLGAIQKITVRKGQPVNFTVRSDVADEVHVHGYDFHREVAKGGSVQFTFPATIDGIFVIELEQRGQQIASLRVTP